MDLVGSTDLVDYPSITFSGINAPLCCFPTVNEYKEVVAKKKGKKTRKPTRMIKISIKGGELDAVFLLTYTAMVVMNEKRLL